MLDPTVKESKESSLFSINKSCYNNKLPQLVKWIAFIQHFVQKNEDPILYYHHFFITLYFQVTHGWYLV